MRSASSVIAPVTIATTTVGSAGLAAYSYFTTASSVAGFSTTASTGVLRLSTAVSAFSGVAILGLIAGRAFYHFRRNDSVIEETQSSIPLSP